MGAWVELVGYVELVGWNWLKWRGHSTPEIAAHIVVGVW